MTDASPDCPDHSTCRNCKKPISWGEHCYAHDDSGMMECNREWTNGSHIDHLRDGVRTYAEPVENNDKS